MIITLFSSSLSVINNVHKQEKMQEKANTYDSWGIGLYFIGFFVSLCFTIFWPAEYKLMSLLCILIVLAAKVCGEFAIAFTHISGGGTATQVKNPRWWQKKWWLDPLPPPLRSR